MKRKFSDKSGPLLWFGEPNDFDCRYRTLFTAGPIDGALTTCAKRLTKFPRSYCFGH